MAHLQPSLITLVASVTGSSGTVTVTALDATNPYYMPSVTSGNTFYYSILSDGAGNWEYGLGTWTATGNGTTTFGTFARTTPIRSSAGLALPATFSGNPVALIFDIPGEKGLFVGPGNTIVNGEFIANAVNILNFSALVAMTQPSVGDMIFAVGYGRTLGDGLGGLFIWKAGNADAADDHTTAYTVNTIAPAVGTGRYKRIMDARSLAELSGGSVAPNGSVYRNATSKDLRSKHSTRGDMRVAETERHYVGTYKTYAEWKAIAPAVWANGDRFLFLGKSQAGDSYPHEMTWDASSTNTDALGVTHLRPDTVTGSNPGRAVRSERTTPAKFADADATPSVLLDEAFVLSDAGTAITGLDDAIDGVLYTLIPGAANVTLTHGASFRMPNAANFVVKSVANGGVPVQVLFVNGIGYVVGASAPQEGAALTPYQFGYSGTGNAGPAINAAIQAAAAGTYKTNIVYLPSGEFVSNEQILVNAGVVFRGAGPVATIITRNYNGTSGVGFLEVTGNGPIIENMAVWAATGTSGGTLAQFKTPVDTARSAAILRGMYITAHISDGCEHSLVIDGTPADSGTNGWRVIQLEHVQVFGSTNYSVKLLGVNGLTWIGGGVYPALGTGVNSGRVQVSGISAVYTEDFKIDIQDVQGWDFDFARNGQVHVQGSPPLTNSNNGGAAEQIGFTVNTTNIGISCADTEGSDAPRNRIINGNGLYNDYQATTAADDAYFINRWYALTESGSVGVSQQFAPRIGSPTAFRLTQSQASAQRFGAAQLLSFSDFADFKGRNASLQAVVKCSASTNIRIAVVAWTGGTDAPTSDVVSNWTSTSYTAGGFFISSNTTIAAVGSAAVSANVEKRIHLPAAIPSNAVNICVFIWTETAQAQNVFLEITDAQFEKGQYPTPYENTSREATRERCLPFYEKTFAEGTAPAQNAGATHSEGMTLLRTDGAQTAHFVKFEKRKRTAPTIVAFNPSAANALARDLTINVDAASTTIGSHGANGFWVFLSNPSSGSPAVGDRMILHWTADAEL